MPSVGLRISLQCLVPVSYDLKEITRSDSIKEELRRNMALSGRSPLRMNLVLLR
jgi:hypothetical protein